MAKSNLINKVKGRIYAGLTVGALSFSSILGYGCGDGPTGPPIPPPEQRISQTATRVNDIGIDYTATLENIPYATRKTLYNGNLVNTRTITGPTYSESIPQNQKGQTCFILEASGVNPDTACINTPNFLPTANFSGLQTDINEEDTTRISLESRFEDKNFEDNPHLRSVQSLDGKTRVNIVGDSVIINAIGDSTGTYRIQLEFGTPEGGIATSVFQGSIYDLPRISGNLESNETHTGIQGTVRFYTINGNDTLSLSTRSSDSLRNNITNSDGSFSFKINKRTSQLENILVMARAGTPNNYQGYVRTIGLPARDTIGVLIRAVPYGQYANNPGIFRTFMQELATDAPNTRFDFNGKFILGFHGLQGIEILSQNPFGQQYGTFTPEQQELIRSKILDPNDISGIIGRNQIDSNKVIIGDQGHYTLDSANLKVIPNSGWVVVVPNLNLGSAGRGDPYYAGTLVYKWVIYMDPNSEGNRRVISHEFGHTFTGTGHPIILPDQTVMNLSTNLENTGIADKKAGMIIYEPKFMVFPRLEYPHVDYLWNILRTDFK